MRQRTYFASLKRKNGKSLITEQCAFATTTNTTTQTAAFTTTRKNSSFYYANICILYIYELFAYIIGFNLEMVNSFACRLFKLLSLNVRFFAEYSKISFIRPSTYSSLIEHQSTLRHIIHVPLTLTSMSDTSSQYI